VNYGDIGDTKCTREYNVIISRDPRKVIETRGTAILFGQDRNRVRGGGQTYGNNRSPAIRNARDDEFSKSDTARYVIISNRFGSINQNV